MNFRNDIQGLRAIAVLLVFFFHLSATSLPGGFIGVDMFFVISGFLVTSIVHAKINKGTFSVMDFYKSRIQRIVPAYLFMLLVVSIVVAFLFVNTDSFPFRRALLWSILFNSNNHFATLDTYFGTANNENPLLHTWTLGVEMQFYFLLPMLLLFIRNQKMLVLVLSSLIIGLCGYSTYHIFNGNAATMYFSLPSRMPEFLIGTLAAVLRLADYNFIKTRSNILSMVGLGIIALSVLLFTELTPFPGATALLPCLGTLLLLLSPNSSLNLFLSKKPFVYIGEISYSIYLWHWPVMALLRYYKSSYEFTFWEIIFVVILTILLSFVSYYFVEKKLRQARGATFLIPFITISGLTAAMVLLTPKINFKLNQLPVEFTSPSYGLTSHGITFEKVGEFGSKTSTSKEILLIGDSHALVMKKYIDIIGKKNNIRFKAITNDTYPTLTGITKEDINNTKYFEQYSNVMKYVDQEIPKADLIILQFADDGDKWQNALKTLLKTMREDQRLLVLSDFPSLDKNPVKINRSIVKRPESGKEYKILKNVISSSMMNIINADKRVKYLDLSQSDVFDHAPFYQDTLMYYDQRHLNEYGSKVYEEKTGEQFMKAINEIINQR